MSLTVLIRGRLQCFKILFKPVNRIAVMKSMDIHTGLLHKRRHTDLNDEPVKFSQSKAKDHVSLVSKTVYPRHMSLSLWVSLVVTWLYFFILREENDLDEKLDALFKLEELDVIKAIDYAKVAGRDTTELELKLEELRRNEVAQK